MCRQNRTKRDMRGVPDANIMKYQVGPKKIPKYYFNFFRGHFYQSNIGRQFRLVRYFRQILKHLKIKVGNNYKILRLMSQDST